MKDSYFYNSKHYRYFNDYIENKKVSRKTKKFIQAAIKEQYLPSLEQVRWMNLPNCKWCSGGTIREHYSDTGYNCPDCRGSGKAGWKLSNDGMLEAKTGLPVKEY